MSQVQTSPAGDAGTTAALGTAPSPDGPGSVAVAGTPPSPSAVVSTPRRLRRLGTALVVLGVVFGVLAALTFVLMVTALGRASASTAQLIRVQQIQTNLLAADATATNAFLVGGLEPPAQRQAYDDAINAATTGITQAAEAESADEQALSRLNEELVAYVALIEDARANNRQGFPVGAQYQRTASATLRADALPLLDNLVDGQRPAGREPDGRLADRHPRGCRSRCAGGSRAGPGLARRGGSAGGSIRAWSPPPSIVLVTWVIGLIAVGATGAAVNGIKDGSFADVNAVATARIQGFNAKSNESLTLIARGSGAAFEKAWTESAATGDHQPGGLVTAAAHPVGRLRRGPSTDPDPRRLRAVGSGRTAGHRHRRGLRQRHLRRLRRADLGLPGSGHHRDGRAGSAVPGSG